MKNLSHFFSFRDKVHQPHAHEDQDSGQYLREIQRVQSHSKSNDWLDESVWCLYSLLIFRLKSIFKDCSYLFHKYLFARKCEIAILCEVWKYNLLEDVSFQFHIIKCGTDKNAYEARTVHYKAMTSFH